jgi:hypothetical protein
MCTNGPFRMPFARLSPVEVTLVTLVGLNIAEDLFEVVQDCPSPNRVSNSPTYRRSSDHSVTAKTSVGLDVRHFEK